MQLVYHGPETVYHTSFLGLSLFILGGCQNYGLFLGPQYNTAPNYGSKGGGCSQALSHESHATVATVGAQVQNSKREMSRLFLRVPKGV